MRWEGMVAPFVFGVVSILMISGVTISGSADPLIVRGSSATHDAGNFTINVGDDGGYSGWDTFEFPKGSDRLSGASFGLGSDSSTVDFGMRNDIDTIDPVRISEPGNLTSEEGFCVFSGEDGQDFDFINVTQRTYVNSYSQDTPGYTGRWMVVDYTLSSEVVPSRDIFAFQMMDVDLSPDNDQFIWDEDYEMAVTHFGTTFIGLSYFNSMGPMISGHNAGEMTSNVFDGEDVIYDHMSNPNNQSTTSTHQNWYMDIVAKISNGTFPGEVHVSFAIVVGNSLDDLRNAVEDARRGIKGEWESTPPEGWQKGHVDLTATYTGIQWPPMSIWTSQSRMVSTRDLVEVDFQITGDREITLHIYTSEEIPDQGSLQYRISSLNPLGYYEGAGIWNFSVDNKGPDISLVSDVEPGSWGTGTVEINALPDDNDGSGTEFIYLSVNGGAYYHGSILEITDDGSDIEVSSYGVDYIGNIGPTTILSGIMNDGTPPVIDSVSTIPGNITEDSQITISVAVKAHDAFSGLNQTTAVFKWGFDTATSAPVSMIWNGSAFIGTITNSWDASQGRDIAITVTVEDIAGNPVSAHHSEYIDPMNDPPEYSMVLRSDPWQGEDFVIEFVGEDPDGDLPDFDLMYSLSEDGGYMEFDDVDIQKMSSVLYNVRIPRIEHEGPIYVKGDATDGIAVAPLDPIQVLIDKKAPVITYKSTPTAWISRGLNLSFFSTDNGSGVSEEWFILRGSGPDIRIDSRIGRIEEEGTFNITAYSRDSSGNAAAENMGIIMIDNTPPEAYEIFMHPEEQDPGDDLGVSIRARDNESGLTDEAEITFVYGNALSISGVGRLQDGMYEIIFEDIPPSPNGSFEIAIKLIDIAGNTIPFDFGPFHYRNETESCPLDIDYPAEIGSGEAFWINITHDGSITLHTKYPGMYWDWILTPKRTEGNTRSFLMPAPYAGDEVQFRIEYGDSGGSNMSECPADGWFDIHIIGSEDRDGDGLEDHWEIEFGLDPSSPDDPDVDSDEDELTNLQEMYNLTDPDNSDTDGDEMPDGWEAKYGTLPFREDPNDDPDGDGWSNVVEMVNGRDPRDPEDHPEETNNTPWYWMVIIFLVLAVIIGYFGFQMISRRKLEDDLDDVDRSAREEEAEDWDKN